MPYGLHWEWRGFGQLEPQLRDRITQLPLVYPTARTVTDHYLWVPGLETNIKLRIWPSGASLKFKRLLRHDEDGNSGVQLWLEPSKDDLPFPLSAEQAAGLSQELGLKLPIQGPVEHVDVLAAQLTAARVNVTRVEKLRWLFQWESGAMKVFVELAELRSHGAEETVGIEDNMGLSEASPEETVEAGRIAVVRARDSLGLPGSLDVCSYLQRLASRLE
jgi:hypothetical protein